MIKYVNPAIAALWREIEKLLMKLCVCVYVRVNEAGEERSFRKVNSRFSEAQQCVLLSGKQSGKEKSTMLSNKNKHKDREKYESAVHNFESESNKKKNAKRE